MSKNILGQLVCAAVGASSYNFGEPLLPNRSMRVVRAIPKKVWLAHALLETVGLRAFILFQMRLVQLLR